MLNEIRGFHGHTTDCGILGYQCLGGTCYLHLRNSSEQGCDVEELYKKGKEIRSSSLSRPQDQSQVSGTGDSPISATCQ
jgi:hypothetical protein